MTGAGNIFRGKNEGQGIDPAIGHYAGMLATMINSLVLADIVKQNGGKAVVLSAVTIPRFMPTLNKITAVEHLEKDEIVICAGGTGNPFNTTDAGSVNRALELECDILIKCTRVDGVYTADPEKDPSATKYDNIHMTDAIKQNLHVMDISAMALALENKMPIYVCNINDIDKRETLEMKGTKVQVS